MQPTRVPVSEAPCRSVGRGVDRSAAPQVEVNVPLPELPSPVTEKDFAPAEAPPPKQAGGGT